MKDFSKITRPLTNLLGKGCTFDFTPEYLKAFKLLKKKLTSAPIQPFELMSNVFDYRLVQSQVNDSISSLM